MRIYHAQVLEIDIITRSIEIKMSHFISFKYIRCVFPPYIIRQFAHPIPIATPLLTSVAAPLLTLYWLWSYPNVALSISSHLVGVMYRFHLEFSREIYSVGSYRFHSQVLNYKFFIMYLLSPEVILKKTRALTK